MIWCVGCRINKLKQTQVQMHTSKKGLINPIYKRRATIKSIFMTNLTKSLKDREFEIEDNIKLDVRS